MRVRATVDQQGRIEMTWRPIQLLRNQTQLRLALAPSPISADEISLFHKTTARTLYDAARAACPEADDTVLWNQRGEITETTIANLVVQKNGVLLTPAAACGLLPGTLRARLLERGILREAVLTVEDLLQAERLFTINSVQRWRPAIVLTDTPNSRATANVCRPVPEALAQPPTYADRYQKHSHRNNQDHRKRKSTRKAR